MLVSATAVLADPLDETSILSTNELNTGPTAGTDQLDPRAQAPQRRYSNTLSDVIVSRMPSPSQNLAGITNGTVVLNLCVDNTGRLKGLRIARSSGASVLDKFIADTAYDIAVFPPPPVKTANECAPYFAGVTYANSAPEAAHTIVKDMPSDVFNALSAPRH